MKARASFLLFAAMLPGFHGLFAGSRPMSFEDLFRVRRVGSPRLSPDGGAVLFTVNEADWRQNRFITHVWRVGSTGGEPVQMTRGDASCYDPKWSPDGSLIAFRSARDGKTQIHLMRADGGEAWQLTRIPSGAGAYAWSRDGSAIYFLAPDTLTAKESKRKKEKDDAYLFDQDRKNVHLWKVDVKTGRLEEVTSGDFSIRNFRLSPGGRKVAFIAAPSPIRDADINNEIYMLDLATNQLRQLTSNRAIERSLRWTPDGKALTFISDSNEELETYYQESIFWLDPGTGQVRDLLPGFPWQVYAHDWMTQDGRPDRILFLANCGVTTQFFTLDPGKGVWKKLTDFQGVYRNFHYRDSLRKLVCVRTDPRRPYDAWIADVPEMRFKQLTQMNTWLDTLALADYQVVRWPSRDGVQVEGILITPPGFDPSRRYPLVLQIHGGPEASYKLSFSTSWVTYPHVLAGQGYVLLQPNYRGSTGYGDEWMRAIIGRYFEKDWDDLMSGVDAMIERGIAHPDSLAVHGWSAGGHLTNWTITHTNRFKAAASGAGGANWFSFYAQTDMHYIREIWHASVPYENWEFWLKKSPVLYVQNATTPTLIFCGENDRRVPFPQSQEMYMGLKRNGCTVEFVVFPREGHGLRELRHQMFKMKKEFAWFQHHVRGLPIPEVTGTPE